jgi:uncharacterized integral membrane protein
MSTSEFTPASATRDRITSRERIASHAPIAESRGQRLLRQGHRIRLYSWAYFLVGLLVVLIALIAANTQAVKLDWVVGSTRASLVWIILGSAVLGWLLGIVTGMVVRHRTRREG